MILGRSRQMVLPVSRMEVECRAGTRRARQKFTNARRQRRLRPKRQPINFVCYPGRRLCLSLRSANILRHSYTARLVRSGFGVLSLPFPHSCVA
ncbi:hypothetical protein GY45DRAFT_267130 [Cubamyces sp. BRFM 1775]|nr:hypothetical protein GY45DRAFT_267130 [Cubamyces sp. BRFM 1775]